MNYLVGCAGNMGIRREIENLVIFYLIPISLSFHFIKGGERKIKKMYSSVSHPLFLLLFFSPLSCIIFLLNIYFFHKILIIEYFIIDKSILFFWLGHYL